MKKKPIWQLLCPDCGAVMAESQNHRDLIGETYKCDGPHDEPLTFIGRQQDLMRKQGTYKEDKIFYDKLIRDNIPEIMDGNNVEYSTRAITSNKELKIKLNDKLIEEVNEFIMKPSIGEFADILEVLDSLREYHNFSVEKIRNAKNLKKNTHGGFKEKIVLEWTRE